MSCEWSIRPVDRSDAQAWGRLRSMLWPDQAQDHQSEIQAFFSGHLEEPQAVLVAGNAVGDVVAFVELSIRTDVPTLESNRTGFIEGLYVVPEMRSTGVTRDLLRASRQWADSNSCVAFASDRSDRFIIDKKFMRAHC